MSPRPGVALFVLLGSAGLGACATKAEVQQLQEDVAMSKAEAGRRDVARAAQLDEIIRMQRGMYDSLAAMGQVVGRLKGDLATDLYNVQQQLVQLQELTGQSQQALSRLRAQLEARLEQMQTATVTDTAAVAARGASEDEMYTASLDQFHRGNAATSRLGLQDLLRTYPTSARAPDALYYIGHSFDVENPDSAAAYYRQVVEKYPSSPRAASALYNLASLAAGRKETTKARELYRQLVEKYPNSSEAELARDKLSKMPSR